LSERCWKVEQECPQCSAPVVLAETDRVFVCQYCRVRLHAANGLAVRYYLPPRDASTDNLFMVPYWRLKGHLFRCVPFELRYARIDATRRAVDLPGLPYSLGVRPQALSLRFATATTPGRLLAPAVQFDEGMARCLKSAAQDSPPIHEALLPDSSCLIYLPVRHDRGLRDAVADRLIASAAGAPPALWEAAEVDEAKAPGVRFLAMLCPECGWDLQADRSSIVAGCSHCASWWQADETGYSRIPTIVPRSTERADCCLPFWRIRPRVSGLALASFADLARLANLPRLVPSEWESLPLDLWLPAFSTHGERYMKIARAFTMARLDTAEPARTGGQVFHPVTVPARSATGILKSFVAELGEPKGILFQALSDIDVESDGHELVYLPFTARGAEFVHPSVPFTIHRNLLRH
jgi:ribosomal protein S27AE